MGIMQMGIVLVIKMTSAMILALKIVKGLFLILPQDAVINVLMKTLILIARRTK